MNCRSACLLALTAATGCFDFGELQMPSGAGGSGGGFAGAGGGGSDSRARCGIDGLVAYYPFDGDTNDHSGGGHDTVATSATPAAGIFDGAYHLDGANSQIRITGGPDLLLGARTLCAWIKPQSVTGFGQPVFAGGEVGRGDLFSLTSSTPSATNTRCMGAREGEPFVDHWGTCTAATGLIARNDEWSFVCYGFDGGNSQWFFVNGETAGSPGQNYAYPISTVSIGSSNLGGGSTRWSFRGAIDEVTIWDRALSSSELDTLWNAGAGCGPTASSGIALATAEDGWLESNAAGAAGRWFVGGDYYAIDGTPGGGSCPIAGFPMTACSSLTAPTPGTPVRPDPQQRMCTAGATAQVIPGRDGSLAWSAIWGNLVGLYLATSDPSPLPVVGAYDAPAHGITGFAFDLDGNLPSGRLRVQVETAENDTDPAYWGGAVDDVSPFQGPGHYEVRWPAVGGPLYLGMSAPPFDPTKVESIVFFVLARDTAALSYDFCIGNVSLLTD